MTDDNLYPNDGDQMGIYFPGEPLERKQARELEDSLLNKSLPVLDEVIEWFEDAIEEANSVDGIQTSTMSVNGVKYSRSVSVEAQVLAQQLLKQKLLDKQSKFIAFKEAHDR